MNPFAGLGQDLKERPGHAYVESITKARRAVNGRPPVRTHLLVDNRWNLTGTQCAVMDCLVEGMGNSEIAGKLGVALKTIEAHMVAALSRISTIEGKKVTRLRAAVLWDRFVRSEQQ